MSREAAHHIINRPTKCAINNVAGSLTTPDVIFFQWHIKRCDGRRPIRSIRRLDDAVARYTPLASPRRTSFVAPIMPRTIINFIEGGDDVIVDDIEAAVRFR